MRRKEIESSSSAKRKSCFFTLSTAFYSMLKHCMLTLKQEIAQETKKEYARQQDALMQQKKRFNPVLKVQIGVCAGLVIAALGCQFYLPNYAAYRNEKYDVFFESDDYTATLLRFAQQAVEALSINAQALDAPEGASFTMYQPSQPLTIPVNQYYISSGYGWREDPFSGAWSFHQGVDFACAEGESVFAVLDGVVERNYLSDSYGNCIFIRHIDGSVSLYAHLQYAFARVGQEVSAGEQIGTVGQTGAATGAHLHFEIIVNNERYDATAALGL